MIGLRRAVAIAVAFVPIGTVAGQPVRAMLDTLAPGPAITVDAFIAQVAAHHPVIRQARLGVEQAREEGRAALGGFDPTLSATWDRKTFGTVAYYDYLTTELKVPTPVGADIKLGFDRTRGEYVNPDRRTPPRGLFSAGLSIPLGQRVLTDERRTAVTVARAVRDGAVADLDVAVNRVLLQATRDYARWYETERRAAIALLGVRLAEFRLAATRQRVIGGDAAPLDTAEALMEALRRRALLVEAEQAAFAARLLAEAHLWDSRGLPDSLPTAVMPSPEQRRTSVLDPAALVATVAAVSRAHPEVQRADARVAQAAAQQRLAAQGRLPNLAADVVALGASDVNDGGDRPGDDLKLGASLRTPLLLLRERGRANAAAARTEALRVERDRTRRDVGVAVRTTSSELEAVAQSGALQRAAVAQAGLLVQGEQRRLDAGESTLFLVNARERMLLEEEGRLAALEARALVLEAERAAVLGTWLTRARATPP